jgi:ribosomal protein L44E
MRHFRSRNIRRQKTIDGKLTVTATLPLAEKIFCMNIYSDKFHAVRKQQSSAGQGKPVERVREWKTKKNLVLRTCTSSSRATASVSAARAS